MMDEEIRDLFAETELQIDPGSRSADLLLESLRTAPAPLRGHGDDVAAPLIDGPAAWDRPRVWILAGAVAATAALIIGALELRVDNASVISEAPDQIQADQNESVDLIFVNGMANPIVMFLETDVDTPSSALTECAAGIREVTAGSTPASMAVASLPPSGLGASTVLSAPGAIGECPPQSDAWTLFSQPASGVELATADSSATTNLGDAYALRISGFVASDVRSMELIGDAVVEQTYRTAFGRFWIDAQLDQEIIDPTMNLSTVLLTFRDGTAIEHELLAETTSSTCRDSGCIRSFIRQLSLDAEASGQAAQADRLRDGVLTQDEYDDSVSAFIDCLASASLARSGVPTVFVIEGTAEFGAGKTCELTTMRWVESARAETNLLLLSGPNDPLGGTEEVVDAETTQPEPDGSSAAPNEREVLSSMWRAEAQRIFQGGLGPNEIRSRNTGAYIDEAAIDAYADHFAWTFEDRLTIETSEYSPFPDTSDAFTPIVTVISQDDPTRSAAFVMRYTLETFRLEVERLPSPEVPELFVETAGDGTTAITIATAGTEGWPQAFVDGEPVPTESDLGSRTTTITIDDPWTGTKVVTLATPTPEAPGAASYGITLEKDFADPIAPQQRIERAELPLVLRVPELGTPDERAAVACAQGVAALPTARFVTPPAVLELSVIDSTRLGSVALALHDPARTWAAFCERPGSGPSGIPGFPLPQIGPDQPANVLTFGSIGATTPDGEPLISIHGQLRADVAEIRLDSPDVIDQAFAASDGWYVIDSVIQPTSPVLSADQTPLLITYTDGRVESFAEGYEVACAGRSCLADVLSSLPSSTESGVLRNGVLTQEEYDAAARRFSGCLGAGADDLSSAVVTIDDDQEFPCYVDFAPIDQARMWISWVTLADG